MTESSRPLSIIIPTINHSIYQRPSPSPQPHQTNHSPQGKVFLIPKHDTYPQALMKRHHQSRRFTPSFDPFDLNHLYSIKKITEDEMVQLSKLTNLDQVELYSPLQEKSDEDEQGSKIVSERKPSGNSPSNKVDTNTNHKKYRSKQKGLKTLSQRAYEIVKQMKMASYKEVAKRLVSQLHLKQIKKGDIQMEKRDKNEKNIKRRVYDALNVLIALGVLSKDGRMIVGKSSNLLDVQESIALKIMKTFSEKQRTLKVKRQRLKDLLIKKQVYQELTKHQGQFDHDKIYFPFLVLENQKQGQAKSNCEGDECTSLNLYWPKVKGDKGNFDIDFLVEYNKRLALLKE